MTHLQLTPERPPADATDDPQVDATQDHAEPSADVGQVGRPGRRFRPDVEPDHDVDADRADRASESRPEDATDDHPADEVRRAAAERLDRLQVERAADEGMTGSTVLDAQGDHPDHDDRDGDGEPR